MADKREIQAPTLEAALREASRALGVPEHDVHYRLIDEGRRGVMGLGQRDVRIEIEVAASKPVPANPGPRRAPEPRDRTAAAPAPPVGANDGAEAKAPAPSAAPEEDEEDRRGNLRRPASTPDDRRGNRRGAPGDGDRRGNRRGRRGGRGARRRGDDDGGSRPPRADQGPGSRRERGRRGPERVPRAETGPPKEIAPETLESFRSTVQTMIEMMELDLAVHAAPTPSGVRVDLDGADAAMVEDRDSEFQSGLQFLLNRMSRRAFPDVGRITVGPQFERHSQRDEDLIAEIHEVAGQVQRTGQAKTLHPMNPYERRLVHLTVREYEGLETRSDGDGFLKTVTVSKS